MKARTVVLLILSVLLALPGAAQEVAPRSAEVIMHHGRPALALDGQPTLPMFYALTDVPGGRWSWEELPQHNIAQFCERGVRLYQLTLFFDDLWMPDGSVDIALARRQIRGVLDVCPAASVILRLYVNPPRWWVQQHPEEWAAYADTDYQPERTFGFPRIIEDDPFPVRRVSMASETWRTEATETLTTVLDRLAASPEGNAFIGMQLAGGLYGEWHNWGFFHNEPDVGAPMQAAFRDWLRAKYETDDALQAAWNDPTVTFATATVLDLDDRKTTHGIFRDPQQEQRAIDYYRAMQEIIADTILHFAATVKAAWPRPAVVGSHYGYFFSVFGRQAAGGHLELQRVLASPDLDYLSGPQAYEPATRDTGDPYRSRSLIASMRLHGKLWLDEMDYEAAIPKYRSNDYVEQLSTDVAHLRRNVAFSITKGQNLWFYDFGPAGVDLDGRYHLHKGSQGYWDHPALLRDIETMKTLFENQMDEPYETGADVLFVYDTESFYYTASLHDTDPVSNTLVDYTTLNTFKSGVVFDPVHLDDLDAVDLSTYSTVVFGTVFHLTPEQRAFIQNEVARDGRHLIWYYAPGYTDGETLDPAFIREVTGLTVAPTTIDGPPEIVLPLSHGYQHTYRLGGTPIAPLFAVEDAEAEALATYAGTGEVAVARKTMDDHTAWYVALPSKDPTLLRHILRQTDAHIYTDQGDIVYAGNGFVMVHTAEGGPRTVTLRNGTRVDFALPPEPATLLLDRATGEVLLGAPEIEPSPPYPSR